MKRANLIEAPKNQQLADILEYLQQIEHRLDNVNLEDNLFLLDRGCHSAHSPSTADKSMHKEKPTKCASKIVSSEYRLSNSGSSHDQKRYIWNEWDESHDEDTNISTTKFKTSRISKHSAAHKAEGKSRNRLSSSASPYIYKSLNALNSTEEPADDTSMIELEHMRIKLKEKGAIVMEKKNMLKKLRADAEVQRTKAEKNHQNKLKMGEQVFQETIKRHRILANRLLADCEELRDKIDSYETQLSRIRSTRSAECEAASKECIKNLKNAREQWIRTEQNQLAKYVDRHSTDIKAAAAQALEPELNRLIESNRRDSKINRERREQQIVEIEEKLKRQFKNAVEDTERSCIENIHASYRRQVQEAKNAEQQLICEHSSQISKICNYARDEQDEERTRFESRRSCLCSSTKKMSQALIEEEKSRLFELERSHRDAVNNLDAAHQRKICLIRKDLEEKTKLWCNAMTNEMKDIRTALISNKIENAQQKINAELSMVIARLSADEELKLKQITDDLHKELEAMHYNHVTAIQEAEQIEYIARKRALDLVHMHADTERKLCKFQSDIATATESAESAHRSLENSQKLFDIVHSDLAKRVVLEDGLNDDIERKKDDIEKMIAQKDIASNRVVKAKEDVEKSIMQIRLEKENDRNATTKRVDSVMNRKKAENAALLKQYEELKVENDRVKAELGRKRSNEYG